MMNNSERAVSFHRWPFLNTFGPPGSSRLQALGVTHWAVRLYCCQRKLAWKALLHIGQPTEMGHRRTLRPQHMRPLLTPPLLASLLAL